MDVKIREAQLEVLGAFSKIKTTFALTGGTALELYYLKHRFSKDLDLFSVKYSAKEVDKIVATLKKSINKEIKLEDHFVLANHAQVRFYTIQVEGASFPLKIDFVEEVLLDRPTIKKINKIPVYDVLDIYFQKITTITGTKHLTDDIGRERISGRQEVRDVIDLYYLSEKVKPLHLFLLDLAREYQRGIVRWYQTFSRQEFKLGFLDFDLYDKELNSVQVIRHMEKEIKEFIKGEMQ